MSPRARIRRNAVEKGRGQLRLAERPCQARPITLEIGSSVLQTRGCSLCTLWKTGLYCGNTGDNPLEKCRLRDSRCSRTSFESIWGSSVCGAGFRSCVEYYLAIRYRIRGYQDSIRIDPLFYRTVSSRFFYLRKYNTH